MRAFWPLLLLGLAVIAPAAGEAAPPDPRAGPAARAVYRFKIDGIIAPSTARFIQRAIREAEAEDAEALIVALDTPGGLLKST
ncbi:MAG: NfeD family protein, partial [bacterium]